MCTFCNLCVVTCPSDAIQFNNQFENAVFTRNKLVQILNQEGSKLREKKKEAKIVETKTEPKSETKSTNSVGLLIGAVANAKTVTSFDEEKSTPATEA